MRHLFDTPLCASPFNRGAPKNIAPVIGAALAMGGSNLISGAVNNIVNRSNMRYQADIAKDLAQYQWDNFQSYPAQVKSMLQAGLNPAAMYSQGGASGSSPSINMPTAVPSQIGLGTSLADIANYTLSLAQAKKAGVETKNVEVETQGKQFELELSKWFSAPAKVAEITLAWKNVMLKDDEHNIKEWQKVKEKTLAGLTGIQKQAAEKELANMDTVIDQQNRQREEDINLTKEKQKTEGTQQSANRAAASASREQANYNRESARLQRALADIEESGKSFKLESLLKHYRASGMLDDASYEKAKKLYKNLVNINKDNDEHSWNQAADDLFYYLGEKIHQISPIGSMLDIDYSKK